MNNVAKKLAINRAPVMVQLVGILNITPDSFSDGGNYLDAEVAIEHAKKLFSDGAAIVDIGAESTKPNAEPVTAAEEWARLEPVLKVLLPTFPNKISLDSYHPETIRRAAAIGSIIINDITGMNNPLMIELAAELQMPVIISHHPAMSIQQSHTLAPIINAQQIKDDLLAKVETLTAKGLPRSKIILDPGIGFGKTMELNAELLRFAELVPDFPVMIGYSRKRFLGDQRMELEQNLAAGTIAIESGAAYIRVHDVAGHRELL